MKTHSQPPKSTETAQPKAEKQAPIDAILAGYGNAIQRKAAEEEEPLQKKVNNTGLPDDLKSGVENLSGIAMDDVKVHYNSSQPSQMQAHAYAQGTDIHVGPGQEKHLPHEAWHVVQQKQGRVKPTMQLKGKVDVNDDTGLETEADVMGAKALQMKAVSGNVMAISNVSNSVIQKKNNYNPETNKVLDRPSETETISDAKKRQKQTANQLNKQAGKKAKIAAKRMVKKSLGNTVSNRDKEDAARKAGALAAKNAREESELNSVSEFTAHHKYPWHSIKEDIEYAFTAPNKPATLVALKNLESFSEHELPIDRDSFLETADKRKDDYNKTPALIDGWIQDVCWTPANIFIGPLSDKRLDDPSKRGEKEKKPEDGEEFDPEKRKVTGLDAHYVKRGLERTMSTRSLALNTLGVGGLSTTKFKTDDHRVAPYVKDEWVTHEKGSIAKEGEPLDRRMYTQAHDPYFGKSIYPYNVTSNDTIQPNYAEDVYELELATANNVGINKIVYDNRHLVSKAIAPLHAVFVLARSEPDKKVWKISFPTPKGFLISNVKMYLTNTSDKVSGGIDLGVNIAHETKEEATQRTENKPSSSIMDDMVDGETLFGGLDGN